MLIVIKILSCNCNIDTLNNCTLRYCLSKQHFLYQFLCLFAVSAAVAPPETTSDGVLFVLLHNFCYIQNLPNVRHGWLSFAKVRGAFHDNESCYQCGQKFEKKKDTFKQNMLNKIFIPLSQ